MRGGAQPGAAPAGGGDGGAEHDQAGRHRVYQGHEESAFGSEAGDGGRLRAAGERVWGGWEGLRLGVFVCVFACGVVYVCLCGCVCLRLHVAAWLCLFAFVCVFVFAFACGGVVVFFCVCVCLCGGVCFSKDFDFVFVI